jgi:hypothetical protein
VTHDPAKARLLRTACAVVAAMAVALVMLSTMRGSQVYRDRNACGARAWTALSFEHRAQVACEPDWAFVGTERVADPLATAAFLALLLLPGLLVWYRPRISFAILWAFADLAIAWLVFLWTFRVDDWAASMRTVELWPAQLYGAILVALLASVIAILPIACGVYALLARFTRAPVEEELPPPAPLPAARIVSSFKR